VLFYVPEGELAIINYQLSIVNCQLPRPFDSAGDVVYTVRNFVLLRLAAHRFVSLHRIAAST